MKKAVFWIVACVVAFGFIKVPAQNAQTTLFFYTWSDYIDPAIIKSFEKKFNAHVAMSFYESDDDMFAKLRLGGTTAYDLVIPSTALGPSMTKAGVLKKLDPKKLPNLKNIAPEFQQLPAGLSAYLVPYQWGTMGVAYRADKLPNLQKTWGIFFDQKQQAGPFALLDVPHETIGAALKYQGKSLNSHNINELKNTLPILKSAIGRSVGLMGGTDAGTKLLSGVAQYVMAYSGNVVRLAAENKNIKYFIPKEGSELFMDTIAIPSHAPHADLAYAFINYLLEPNTGAQLSNFNRYGTPNHAAKPLIAAEDLNNPIIYPDKNAMKRLEMIGGLGNAETIYSSLWSSLKAR